jgi:hypothetical protein
MPRVAKPVSSSHSTYKLVQGYVTRRVQGPTCRTLLFGGLFLLDFSLLQAATKRRVHSEHGTIGQRCATWLHRESVRLCRQKQLCTRLVKVIAVIQTLMVPVSA